MPVCVRMDTVRTVRFPNLFSAMWKGVTALLWGSIKLGIRSYSKWGINVHYKLHGLEATNDNAFKRTVVLHSYSPMPETEVYPMHLPLGISQGCPVISDEVMKEVDILLKAAKKPVLLWIYD